VGEDVTMRRFDAFDEEGEEDGESFEGVGRGGEAVEMKREGWGRDARFWFGEGEGLDLVEGEEGGEMRLGG